MSVKLANDFEEAARQESASGFFREYWSFLRHTKKWWLLPILLVLLLFGLLMLASSTAAAPFIYTLF
jgi:drug/metabolite transporter superfamily protein YnfA